VTQSFAHIDDERLSAFVDQQLNPDESAEVLAHLRTCPECPARLEAFRSVAALLRRLPEVEPPRDFSLGPRPVADPPNVVRLRRWYAASRVAAGTLAAMCIFLVAGTLYVGSQPTATGSGQDARPLAVVASASPTQAALPPIAPRAAAPAQAPAAAALSRATPSNPQADDQVAAATSVSPLPTPVPTPAPTPLAAPVAALTANAPPENLPAVGFVAIGVGLLAIVALLIAFFIRHRLQRASHS